jgi:peptidyl-prolyl cis-trans isomerase B (cyclophilin B)
MNRRKPKFDRKALMKKIRAMLAKRRRQQMLAKKRVALGTKPPATSRPVAPTGKVPFAPTAPKGKSSLVELQTSMGNIVLQLADKKAPVTVANFLKYVRSGHYNGTIFHRVIPNFMIQGGGLNASMVKKPTRAPIKNEADNGLQNNYGTIAMARTSAPHSASAQFFINTKNNRFLNFRSKSMRGWGYCVFGKVIKGMDVVMKISGTRTGFKGGRRNVPMAPIMIKKAVVLQ